MNNYLNIDELTSELDIGECGDEHGVQKLSAIGMPYKVRYITNGDDTAIYFKIGESFIISTKLFNLLFKTNKNKKTGQMKNN